MTAGKVVVGSGRTLTVAAAEEVVAESTGVGEHRPIGPRSHRSSMERSPVLLRKELEPVVEVHHSQKAGMSMLHRIP